MALDRSLESFSPQMNSISLFLWFQLVTLGVGPKVYKEMLHTKNLSSIPLSFREKEFWSWSSLFLCSNLWSRCGVSFDSKGIIWILLIKVHKEMPNTKYQSSNPCSFREEEFWSWFSLFLCSNLWPLGRGQFWHHQHHMNKLGRGPQRGAKHQISKLYAFQFRGEEFWRWDSLFPCSKLWPPGWGQSWPQEHHLKKLGRGLLEDATYQISKL